MRDHWLTAGHCRIWALVHQVLYVVLFAFLSPDLDSWENHVEWVITAHQLVVRFFAWNSTKAHITEVSILQSYLKRVRRLPSLAMTSLQRSAWWEAQSQGNLAPEKITCMSFSLLGIHPEVHVVEKFLFSSHTEKSKETAKSSYDVFWGVQAVKEAQEQRRPVGPDPWENHMHRILEFQRLVSRASDLIEYSEVVFQANKRHM